LRANAAPLKCRHKKPAWGIDCVIPMRGEETEGSGKDRRDCMPQFRAAWDRFSADPARLTEFLQMKPGSGHEDLMANKFQGMLCFVSYD
jgi:hypothetical protein